MRIVFLFFILSIAMVSISCATYQKVLTEDASDKEVAGTYSLILYNSTSGNNLERVAILSKEDAPCPILPYAPEFEYRIIKHMPAKDALDRAYIFISAHPDFCRNRLTRIVDPNSGALLGYEMRPLYSGMAEGSEDVFYVDYWKNDGKVFAKMNLIFQVDRRVNSSGP